MEPTAATIQLPAPIPNNNPSIHDLVIQEVQGKYPQLAAGFKERKEFGIEKYGTTLQAGNGRDGLVEAYQELLDASVYLRKCIEEGKQGLKLVYLRSIELAEEIRVLGLKGND